MKTTTLAVDGNSLAHRAWWAYENDTQKALRKEGVSETNPKKYIEAGLNNNGRATFCTYGFYALLAGIVDITRPDKIVIGFDSRENWRKKELPSYKAQRSKKDETLYQQLDDIQTLGKEAGFQILEIEEYEADDIVGSVAKLAETAGENCIIATSDKDSFQLITNSVSVMKLGNGLKNAETVTPDSLFAKLGIRPNQYLSYAAMRGDTSDNLKGITGIGEKTAVKILSQGTVEEIVEEPQNYDLTKSIVTKLLEGQNAYKINMRIMKIEQDLNIRITGELPNQTKLENVFEKWNMPNLSRRYTSLTFEPPVPTSNDPNEIPFELLHETNQKSENSETSNEQPELTLFDDPAANYENEPSEPKPKKPVVNTRAKYDGNKPKKWVI